DDGTVKRLNNSGPVTCLRSPPTGKGGEDVRPERRQMRCRRESQVPEPVVAARHDAEKILVAAERGKVVVRAGGVHRAWGDELRVEKHGAGLAASRVRKSAGGRRLLQAEQRHHGAESGIRD